MDLNQLRAFVAVSTSSSFSRAAEQLQLTQPATSKRIAALEQELGSRLFDRIGGSVQVTEAGRLLLPRARDILARVEDSRRLLANLQGKVGGFLRLGTSHHIGLRRLPPVLRGFTDRWQNVELDVQFLSSEMVLREVIHGGLELGIVTLPELPAPALETECIWRDLLTIVCASHHPLAHAAQSLGELAHHRAVLPGPDTFTRQLIDRALGREALDPAHITCADSLEAIRALVSAGLGWSVLPVSMVGDDVVNLDFGGLALERRLGVVVHRNRTLSNAARAMVAELRQSPTAVTTEAVDAAHE